MLDFLVRFFGVMTAGVFLLATVVGIISNIIGFNFGVDVSEKKQKRLEYQEKIVSQEQTLSTDLTASIYQMDSKVDIDSVEAGIDVVSENNIIEEEELTLEDVNDLKLLLEKGEVMVLLNNSVIESFLYEDSEKILTKVVKVYDDYVETSKGGMDFKGGSIYTIDDFFMAYRAAGMNFELILE